MYACIVDMRYHPTPQNMAPLQKKRKWEKAERSLETDRRGLARKLPRREMAIRNALILGTCLYVLGNVLKVWLYYNYYVQLQTKYRKELNTIHE